MICHNCGKVIADDSAACRYCGAELESSAGFFSAPGNVGDAPSAREMPAASPGGVEKAPSSKLIISSPGSSRPSPASTPERIFAEPAGVRSEHLSAPERRCRGCGAKIQAGIKFCAVCGTAVNPEPYSAPGVGGERKPMTPGQKKKLKIAGIAAAAACLIGLAIFGIFALIAANGPFAQIFKAMDKTLKADSFTVDFLYEDWDDSYGDSIGATIQIAMDLSNEELTAVIRTSDDDEEYVYAIYNGYLLFYSDYGVEKQDISAELRSFLFDPYNTYGDLDFSDLDIAEFLREIDPSGELYRELSKEFDVDELSNCLQVFLKQLNDEAWLEEYAGYSRSERGNRTTYSFALDYKTIPKFLEAALDTFQTAVRSTADYYAAREDIADLEAYLQRAGNRGSVEFSTEGNYLTSASYVWKERNDTIRVTLDFSKIGSTRIDVEELEYWLDIAEYERIIY